MDFQSLGDARLVPDQQPQTRPERVRQRVGERRQEDTRVFIGARQVYGAMQCNDRLPGPRGTGDTNRPAELALDKLPLRRMQKVSPLLPGRLERALQLLAAL